MPYRLPGSGPSFFKETPHCPAFVPPFGTLTCCDDDRLSPHRPRRGSNHERPRGEIDSLDVFRLEHRAPSLPLIPHAEHQLGPRDPGWEAREVVHLVHYDRRGTRDTGHGTRERGFQVIACEPRADRLAVSGRNRSYNGRAIYIDLAFHGGRSGTVLIDFKLQPR